MYLLFLILNIKSLVGNALYPLDVFSNEIIASFVTNKAGNNSPYYHCLEYLNKKKKLAYPATIHTSQGSVHSSMFFYGLLFLDKYI